MFYDAETNRSGILEPFIVEAGSVAPSKVEFSLPDISQNITGDEAFSLTDDSALWCLEWVVFDPNGNRHDALMPAFTTDMRFGFDEDDTNPNVALKLDYPKGPTRLVSRGCSKAEPL